MRAQTLYVVTVAYLTSSKNLILRTANFKVSGRNPLTRDEAINRAEPAIRKVLTDEGSGELHYLQSQVSPVSVTW